MVIQTVGLLTPHVFINIPSSVTLKIELQKQLLEQFRDCIQGFGACRSL